jgi:hypothetical protein
MKTPVVLVATALTVAILLTASLLITTGTRSESIHPLAPISTPPAAE